MSRRAIPVLLVALGSCWAVPEYTRAAGARAAAPVPPGPKADDPVPPSAVRLLEHRRVQKELKMTAEQRIAIADGLADLEEEYEKKVEALSRAQNATDEQFDELTREHQKGIDKVLTDAATKGLTAAQRTRLQQLDRRVRGVAAFGDARVEKVLQLTDVQKKRAAELAAQVKGEAGRYFDLSSEDDATRKADLLAFRRDAQKQMEAALTADQKTGWAVLAGAAATGFEADELWLKAEEGSDLLTPGPGK